MCVQKFLPNNYKGCVGIIKVNGASPSLVRWPLKLMFKRACMCEGTCTCEGIKSRVGKYFKQSLIIGSVTL